MANSSQGIDLNKASLNELTKLPMVGEQRAQFIIDARPFKDWEDASRIPGFSKEMLADIGKGGATIDGEGWEDESQPQTSESDETDEKSSGRSQSARSRPRDEDGQFVSEDDDEKKSSGSGTEHRGHVASKDDGRLKENRDQGIHKGDETRHRKNEEESA